MSDTDHIGTVDGAIDRRTLLGAAGTGLLALSGCIDRFFSSTPPHGSVAVENDGDQPYEVAATVTDEGGEVVLDRRFTVDPGDLQATDQVIERQGSYDVRAEVDGGTWESRVDFENEGPDGEEIYGYILLYVTGPPTDLSIGGPPDGGPDSTP